MKQKVRDLVYVLYNSKKEKRKTIDSWAFSPLLAFIVYIGFSRTTHLWFFNKRDLLICVLNELWMFPSDFEFGKVSFFPSYFGELL